MTTDGKISSMIGLEERKIDNVVMAPSGAASLRVDRSAESWSGKPFVTEALRSGRKAGFYPNANEATVYTPHSTLRMGQGTLGTET